MDLALNNLQRLICPKPHPTNQLTKALQPYFLNRRTNRIKLRPSTLTIAYQLYVQAKGSLLNNFIPLFSGLSKNKTSVFCSTRFYSVIFMNILFSNNQVTGLKSRVFANNLGDRGSIPGRAIPKTQKMVLDSALLSTQHFKVRIKGKVVQSWEWSSVLPYSSV